MRLTLQHVFSLFSRRSQNSQMKPLGCGQSRQPWNFHKNRDRFLWMLGSAVLCFSGFIFSHLLPTSRSRFSLNQKPKSDHGEHLANPLIVPAISVRNLTKRYGHVTAVADFELWTFQPVIPSRLWGANGAGKTTVLRCILGILPFEGSVTLSHNGRKHTRFLGGKFITHTG